MANNWMRLLANAGGIMGTQRREKKPPKWGTPPFVADYDDDEDETPPFVAEYDDEDETPVPATRPRRVQTEPVPEVDPSQITMFGDRPRIVPEQLPPTMGTADAERSPMSADAPQPRRRSMEGDMTALQEALQSEMDRPIENRKTKGWFGKLKRGFGKFARSMEQGGSLVGSIMNAADPTWDERQNKQNNINQMLAQYTTLNNVKKAEQDRRMQESQIKFAEQRPDIELEKIRLKTIDTNTRANRAEAISRYQDEIIALRKQGVEQNDRRITALEKQIEETKRANLEREKDRDLDRESREFIAKNRESGMTSRMEYTEAQKAQRIAIAAQIKAALEAVKAQPDNPEAKAKLEALRKQAAALQ